MCEDLGGVRGFSLGRWEAARRELTVRFGLPGPLLLLPLKPFTDGHNDFLLFVKCMADLLNVVRDADCLIADELSLEILHIVPLHFLSLEVVINHLEALNALQELDLLQVQIFVCFE